MTRIDRYIAWLFLRTVVICFVSLAGVVIVFHAFTSMDDLVRRGQTEGGLLPVILRFYGPYLLLLFDWTGAIISLMAVLFTAGFLRRSGELTAALTAGVSHGRLFRPMVVVAGGLVLMQLASREYLLPQYRDALSTKSKTQADRPQPVLAQYDKIHRVWIDADELVVAGRRLDRPGFRIDADYPGFGDMMLAESARYLSAGERTEAGFVAPWGGYLMDQISRPIGVADLVGPRHEGRPVLITRRDDPAVGADQCFVVTDVGFDVIQTNELTTKLASVAELIGRVRNAALHCSDKTRVMLHERIVRVPLDIGLICLVLPLAASADRKILSSVGSALGIVVGFFALKTLASAMGSGGTTLSPAWAAWAPLLLVGPVGYARLRGIAQV